MTKKPKPVEVATPESFLSGGALGGLPGAILEMGLGAAMERVAAKPTNALTVKVEPKATADLAKELAKEPVFINATNSEPWWQSRVLVGNSTASVGMVINAGVMILRSLGFEIEDSTAIVWTQNIGALLTVYGLGLSFYGRLKSGLAPLFGWFKR
jgi:hypothetical protein